MPLNPLVFQKSQKKDILNFVKQLPVLPSYWSTLESRFHEILRAYTLDMDYDDILYQWLKSVRNALSAEWEQHSASVTTGDVWAIRALVKAEEPVRRKLKELHVEILKLEQQREVA